MPKPVTVGEIVKIKATSRTVFHGIANIQAEVKAKIGPVITIEIDDHLYLTSDDEVERIEEPGQG